MEAKYGYMSSFTFRANRGQPVAASGFKLVARPWANRANFSSLSDRSLTFGVAKADNAFVSIT
jgi:hypothetical protein